MSVISKLDEIAARSVRYELIEGELVAEGGDFLPSYEWEGLPEILFWAENDFITAGFPTACDLIPKHQRKYVKLDNMTREEREEMIPLIEEAIETRDFCLVQAALKQMRLKRSKAHDPA